jgi:hypothetical protein
MHINLKYLDGIKIIKFISVLVHGYHEKYGTFFKSSLELAIAWLLLDIHAHGDFKTISGTMKSPPPKYP